MVKGQQEMQERMKRSQQEMQERMEKGQQEMHERLEKCQQEMQRSQEETKKGLENVQKSQEETKKGQEELKNSLEIKIDNVEEKINSVEERIATLISQRMEDLEKKLRTGRNENESKTVPVSAFPDLVLASPVPVTAFTGPGVKACQLASSLRGEDAEVLQTLRDTERLNLNSLYNALDLRFGQKYYKDYARLQMKTRLLKTGEILQEYASEVERLANLAFSDHPATVRE
ncbi:uncharacterized protein TNCV_1179471 [Trichonephila clavipes]|nr:uncharacterized protein TNCV_1179471 [Trichonephila clavipes]